jgi:ABC-2 type transport system permease protein
VAREDLPPVLEALSNVLPLSYAVDAMNAVATLAEPLAEVLPDIGVIVLWIAASLLFGSLTLRRRTP